jgi:hypothetical protein
MTYRIDSRESYRKSQPAGLFLGWTKTCSLHRLRNKPPTFCHSERSEESLFLFRGLNQGEIPRFARNDKINYFFRNL